MNTKAFLFALVAIKVAADPILVPSTDLLSAFNVLTTPPLQFVNSVHNKLVEKLKKSAVSAINGASDVLQTALMDEPAVKLAKSARKMRSASLSKAGNVTETIRAPTTKQIKPRIKLVAESVFLPARVLTKLVPKVTNAVRIKSQKLVQKANMKKLMQSSPLMNVHDVTANETPVKVKSTKLSDQEEVFENMKFLSSMLEKLMKQYDDTDEDESDDSELSATEQWIYRDEDQECDSDAEESDLESSDCDDDDYDEWYRTYGYNINGTSKRNLTQEYEKFKNSLRNSTNSLRWRYSMVMEDNTEFFPPIKISGATFDFVHFFTLGVAIMMTLL